MYLTTKIGRLTQSKVSDGTPVEARGTNSGELIAQSRCISTHGFCDDGIYYKALLPLGTAAITFSSAIRTTFTATNPIIYMRNDSITNGNTIYLDYIRLNITTAGTAGTRVEAGIVLDVIKDRYTSGGTLLNSFNTNVLFANNESCAAIYAGNITVAAASNQAQSVSRFCLKAAAQVAGDSYTIFCSNSHPTQSNSGQATISPIILQPGINHQMLLHLWWPGQSASGTGDFEIGWWER